MMKYWASKAVNLRHPPFGIFEVNRLPQSFSRFNFIASQTSLVPDQPARYKCHLASSTRQRFDSEDPCSDKE
jgi:hypothetical protein